MGLMQQKLKCCITSYYTELTGALVCKQNLKFLSLNFLKLENELKPRRKNVYFAMKLQMFSINSAQSKNH